MLQEQLAMEATNRPPCVKFALYEPQPSWRSLEDGRTSGPVLEMISFAARTTLSLLYRLRCMNLGSWEPAATTVAGVK